MNHPSIVDVVGRYTELKRAGQEWRGLCPFHSEKTASFFVNEEKEVFYCHGCLEGGDVITFIEKAEGLGFKDAREHLGLETAPRRHRIESTRRDEAKDIVAWAMALSNLIGEKLREIGQEERLLREFTDKELANWKRGVLKRQWDILVVIDDDLTDPVCLIELWKHRDIIEGLLAL